MAVNMESLVARLEAVAARLEAQAGAPAAAKTTASTPGAKTDAAGGVAPSVAAFDALIAGPLAELVAATGALGDAEIADATALFADAFNAADLRNVCTEAGMFAIRAERDYGSLVALASGCLAPGGWLLCTTNCRRLPEAGFDHMVSSALPRGVRLQNHPMPPDFTDAPYLKTLFVET